MNIIKVSANSRTAAVAGAIAGVMRDNRYAEVQSIGAGAVNQSVKAIILAKGFLVDDGIDLICVPEFVEVDIEGKIRTAVKIVVTPRGEDTAPKPSVEESVTEPEAEIAAETEIVAEVEEAETKEEEEVL